MSSNNGWLNFALQSSDYNYWPFASLIVLQFLINHSQRNANLVWDFPSTNSLHCSRESPVSMPLILKRHISCRLLTCFLKTGRKKPSRVSVVTIIESDLLHCFMLTSEAESGSFGKTCEKMTSFSWILTSSENDKTKHTHTYTYTKRFHLLSVLHSHCLVFSFLRTLQNYSQPLYFQMSSCYLVFMQYKLKSKNIVLVYFKRI